MTANERRAEIIRILLSRRRESMCRLAIELGVTDRTIRNDVVVLMVDYPLETEVGCHGCVKLSSWYHLHQNILSKEETVTLVNLLDKADESEQKVVRAMLAKLGSIAIREQYTV